MFVRHHPRRGASPRTKRRGRRVRPGPPRPRFRSPRSQRRGDGSKDRASGDPGGLLPRAPEIPADPHASLPKKTRMCPLPRFHPSSVPDTPRPLVPRRPARMPRSRQASKRERRGNGTRKLRLPRRLRVRRIFLSMAQRIPSACVQPASEPVRSGLREGGARGAALVHGVQGRLRSATRPAGWASRCRRWSPRRWSRCSRWRSLRCWAWPWARHVRRGERRAAVYPVGVVVRDPRRLDVHARGEQVEARAVV
jgi:hypothetical protein